MTKISFINRNRCIRTAKELRKWAKLGGFETTIETEDECFDITLSVDQSEHAADQFEAYSEKGEYFANIIAYPHFSANEQAAILNIF